MRWLLLRGLTREARHWGDFVGVFASGVGAASAVTLDLPGVGTQVGQPVPMSVGGMADDLRARFVALRASAGDGPWGLFAVSLGGMIALDWLARYPSDFARAVVVNTSAGDLSTPWERLRWRQYPRVMKALVSGPEARERLILAMTSSMTDRARLEQTANAWAQLPPVSPSVALRQLVAAGSSRLPRQVTVPTLMLVSTKDQLVSAACSERIAQELQLPVRRHPTAGHDLPLDDAPWVTQQVARWLQELS